MAHALGLCRRGRAAGDLSGGALEEEREPDRSCKPRCLRQHPGANADAGVFCGARARWALCLARRGWPLSHDSRRESVHPLWARRGNLRQPALPAAFVAERRSRAAVAQFRSARPHYIQNDLYCLPPAHPDDRRRRLLGEPCLGLLLELGSQGDVGGNHVARVCRISTHAHHSRLARTARGLLCNPRICGGNVYLFWRHLLAAGIACICLSLYTALPRPEARKARLQRSPQGPGHEVPSAWGMATLVLWGTATTAAQ